MERWKDVKGFEGLYKVSTEGRVLTVATGLQRKCNLWGENTVIMGLCKNSKYTQYSLAKLVALHFLPPPSTGKDRVFHLDHNPENNRVSNLQWASHSDISHILYDTGRIAQPRGEASNAAKVTEKDIHEMRRQRREGVSYRELGKQYGLSKCAIGYILTGRSWKHLDLKPLPKMYAKRNEEWRPVVGYENLYDISSAGRVRNAETKKLRKRRVNSFGCYSLPLYKNKVETEYSVASLVGNAFLKRGGKPLCVHRSKNKLDDRPANLHWVTHEEFYQMKVIEHARGEAQGHAKLTDEAVRDMRHKVKCGRSQRSLAIEYGVSQNAARLAIIGETWRHVA